MKPVKTVKHESVDDDIFGAFNEEPEPEKKEEKKEAPKSQLKLEIEKLIASSAQLCSQQNLPHLALYLLKGESNLIKERIYF